MLWTRRTISIVSGLILAAGLYLMATPGQSVPSIMQAQQVEVVNAEGTVVFSIRATEAGGRLEVRDGVGKMIFSAGVDLEAPQQFGLWEQSRRAIEGQRRDLERQRRDLNHLITRLQAFERQNLKLSRTTRRGHELDQYRNALARQDRKIDNLERQVNRLSRQLNSLERRQ